MDAFVDEKCFEDARDPCRKALLDYCEKAGVRIQYTDLPSASRVTRPEVIAVAGLGVAALALVVSYLQLRQGAKKGMTRRQLIEEIDAYLRLRGIENYTFVYESGFENIENNTGRPCVVHVRIGSGGEVNLYFGVTAEKLWLSTVDVDWKQLT